jgi:hypothetical protein
MVDRALHAHRWGQDEAVAFRLLRHRLTRDEHEALRAKLIPAVNRGEVKVMVRGPVL